MQKNFQTKEKNIAYFDCGNGISGDMCLGALIDAGADIDELKKILSGLPLDGWDITVSETEHRHIRALKADVTYPHEHCHRHLSDIEDIIKKAALPEAVEANALAVFKRLAEAEAFVHNCTVSEIHFHEVGAMDAIIDIAGSCAALYLLNIEEVYAAAIPMGHGSIECAHGTIPLPAPAVVELCKGFPVVMRDIEGELTTPTGAAIITALVPKENFKAMPEINMSGCGYGAGTKDFGIPNILRVIVGQKTMGEADNEVTVLTTVIDDMSGEFFGYLWGKLFAAGALDLYYQSTMMKKGRPAIEITLLCPPGNETRLAEILLAETTTLGLRTRKETRICLDYKINTVHTVYGEITVKTGGTGESATVSPEYENCRQIAEKYHVPLKTVYMAAVSAYYRQNNKQENSKTALLFDLDGTLVDSIPLIVESSRLTALELGINISEREIINMIGLPLIQAGDSFLGEGGGEIYHRTYQKHFASLYENYFKLFPGVVEMLTECRSLGAKMAIVTSKSELGANITIDRLGLRDFFDLIVTCNSGCGHKPQPEPAIFAMEKLNATPADCVFIGDSMYDIQCGRDAGTSTCAVTWGAGTTEELLAERPDKTANTVDELRQYLKVFIKR